MTICGVEITDKIRSVILLATLDLEERLCRKTTEAEGELIILRVVRHFLPAPVEKSKLH